MLALLLLPMLLFSFSLNTMERKQENEENFALKISLVEAYMAPAFTLEEGAIVFKDYKSDKTHKMLLTEAGRVLYEFRRDRTDVNSFRTMLNVLFFNLRGDNLKDLTEQEILTFQLYRLYRFDFFEKDIDEQRLALLKKSSEAIHQNTALYTHDAIAAEKSKKAHEEHTELLAKTPPLCNTIKTNRVAYSAAFSMADVELVAGHITIPLRLKPITPLAQAIKGLRTLAAQKNPSNPFELTEL